MYSERVDDAVPQQDIGIIMADNSSVTEEVPNIFPRCIATALT